MSIRRSLLVWTPRVLLILFALFLIIFSLDVFEEGKSAMQIGIALILHNIPTMLLGLVVFAAWRREWIGLFSCVLLAAAWVLWAWGRFPLLNYFIMVGPLILVAALYAANWWLRVHANPKL
jgi:hypothetical protein